jgi:hypothetical protein
MNGEIEITLRKSIIKKKIEIEMFFKPDEMTVTKGQIIAFRKHW